MKRDDIKNFRLLLVLVSGGIFSILCILLFHEGRILLGVVGLVLVYCAWLVDCDHDFHVVPIMFVFGAIVEFFLYTNYILFSFFFVISLFSFMRGKIIDGG